MQILTIDQNFTSYKVSVFESSDNVSLIKESKLIKTFEFSPVLTTKKANIVICYNSIFRVIEQKLKVCGMNESCYFNFNKPGVLKSRIFKYQNYQIVSASRNMLKIGNLNRYKNRNAILTSVILENDHPIGGVVCFYDSKEHNAEIFITEHNFDSYYFLLAYIYHKDLGLNKLR